ncbi:MAG TPA: aldehyde dehydrogenase family protein [Thermoanaerobaculia bacterium]|nr:aldehyde dehydrogenase family protein [Thermoanaerobaculia bacterium]
MVSASPADPPPPDQPASAPAPSTIGPGGGPGRPAKAPLPPTPRQEMDRAVAELQAAKAGWAAVPVGERLALLERLRRDFAAVAERWAAACMAAAGLDAGLPAAGEPALTGPYFVLRNLRLLAESLAGIAAGGAPRLPGPVRQRDGGQVVARIFPQDVYDRLFYAGVTAEAWMQPGVSAEDLAATQAVAYRRRDGGGVALVLGAGNVSSIGPMDALYKLFVENRVVLFKTHPVNDYLGPLLAEAFRALSERACFRLVYGGAAEGAYLCAHPGVDEIHITGSDRTYEAIVFGPGEEGRRRKAEDAPLLHKPVSAELGNVSPVIVVPGPAGAWSDGDVAFQAENLVTMLANNAGFNCNATRVLIQHAASPERERLLAAIRGLLARTPPRRAYYPGAAERWRSFLAAHPEAELLGAGAAGRAKGGNDADGTLPWTLIAGLDPGKEGEICFTTEAFCSLFGEAPIAAASVADYVERAVAFANERLWGTLNASLIVHPAALRDPAVAAAVEKAIADLRYGTVSVNHWAAIGYGLVVTPWGAFPGHTRQDIQSGTGVVHNTLMFSRVEKSVVRAPFRVFPKPVWFLTHRTAHRLTPRLVRFEAAPSPAKLPAIFSLALRG